MKTLAAALIFGTLIYLHTYAANTESSFIFIVEDDQAIEATGIASYREMYAKVLAQLRIQGVGSVALKFFFFDELGSEQDDGLAAEMAKTTTLLQYALRGEEQSSHRTPVLGKIVAEGKLSQGIQLISDKQSQFPIIKFSKSATKLGFVDIVEPFDLNLIPMVATYEDDLVESLALQLLEQQFGKSNVDGTSISFTVKKLELDPQGRFFCDVDDAPKPKFLSMTEFLIKQNEISNTNDTAILMYVGRDAPEISTGFFSSMQVHELFARRLVCVESQLRD